VLSTKNEKLPGINFFKIQPHTYINKLKSHRRTDLYRAFYRTACAISLQWIINTVFSIRKYIMKLGNKRMFLILKQN